MTPAGLRRFASRPNSAVGSVCEPLIGSSPGWDSVRLEGGYCRSFFSFNGAQERKGHLVFGIGCKPFVYRGFLFCLFRLCAVLCAVSSTTLEGSFSPSVSYRSSWLRGWVGVTVEGPKIASKRLYS